MPVIDACDGCASRKSDQPLISTTIKVLTDFDSTGKEIYSPKKGKWCGYSCIRKTILYYRAEALKLVQRRRDHEEDQVMKVRQLYRGERLNIRDVLPVLRQLLAVKQKPNRAECRLSDSPIR